MVLFLIAISTALNHSTHENQTTGKCYVLKQIHQFKSLAQGPITVRSYHVTDHILSTDWPTLHINLRLYVTLQATISNSPPQNQSEELTLNF